MRLGMTVPRKKERSSRMRKSIRRVRLTSSTLSRPTQALAGGVDVVHLAVERGQADEIGAFRDEPLEAHALQFVLAASAQVVSRDSLMSVSSRMRSASEAARLARCRKGPGRGAKDRSAAVRRSPAHGLSHGSLG